MTIFLVIVVAVVAVVIVVAVVWALFRRRRPPSPGVARDAPSLEMEDALGAGLAKARRALGERVAVLLNRGAVAATWDELEELLLAADVGVAATTAIVRRVRQRAPAGGVRARDALREELTGVFAGRDRSLKLRGDPAVVVVVGVNGSGKTTTIAKLGARLEGEGRSVLLGAADTFRAAASEQLGVWSERLGLDLVTGHPGADPASVAFDSLAAARARGKKVLLVDTAGRLHSKHNLMEELGKVVRVLRREAGDLSEVLLVLDGTTGQNGIAQARTFTEVVGVTGVVLTKLDGTARGGLAVAVEGDLAVPVKFVGVGEGVDDLVPFEARTFVDALLGG